MTTEGVALWWRTRERIRRPLGRRYLDEEADDLADAVERCLRAKRERRALSVAVRANAAEVIELLGLGRRGDRPDERARPAPGIHPAGLTLDEADHLRREDPEEYIYRARVSAAAHCFAMVGLVDEARRSIEIRNTSARGEL